MHLRNRLLEKFPHIFTTQMLSTSHFDIVNDNNKIQTVLISECVMQPSIFTKMTSFEFAYYFEVYLNKRYDPWEFQVKIITP